MLRPGAARMIIFHIVADGSCWVALNDGEKHWASRGDVLVMPYGDQHTVGGHGAADVVPIATGARRAFPPGARPLPDPLPDGVADAIAEELLASTDHGVAAIARRVGYDAEEAFSRAFKRARESSPGAWRAARR